MSRQWHWPLLGWMIAALLSVPAVAQQDGVHWQQDIEAARAMARQTRRLVLVHFWMPNCGPCLALEQNVFNQPGVAGALESQFVPVKLNANENSATATAFGITRVPTDVILTPDGHIVDRRISPPTPAAYVAEMSQVAAQYASRPGQAFAMAAAAAPSPPQLNAAYAGLQIAPSTMPAASSQASHVPQDRYALAASAAPATVGTAGSVLGRPNLLQSAQGGSAATWSAPPIAGPAASGPAPSAVAASGPSTATYNPYAQAAASSAVAPPLVLSPVQVVNRYAPASGPGGQTSTLSPSFAMTSATLPNESAAVPNQPPGATDPRALPPTEPPLGFDGFCPVSMRTQWKWVPGNPRWAIVHRGRTYWFAGPNEQQLFWADPDHYSPALSGMDPVMAVDHRQPVPGKREHSLDYDNLFYMFASEATLQQFAANPDRYSASVRQAMGIPRGRLVR